MKHSIKKIFTTLNTYLFFVLFIAFLSIILTLEQQLSFEKVNNLNQQKEIIKSLTTLNKEDIELALIQFNGKSAQLHQKIDKLKSLNKYDYCSKYCFTHEEEYLNELNSLSQLTTVFNKAAHEFYVEDANKELKKQAKKNLEAAFATIINKINNILIQNIEYSQEKFRITKMVTIAIFLIILLTTFIYKKRLFFIYKDIEYLYQIEKAKKEYTIYTLEADAIAMRMNRKNNTNDNPTMIDPLTGINNYKGMVNSYSNKKNLKDSNFTAVTILEIDNFSKSEHTFSQEMTQSILKKLAYTLSLYEQAVDVIARTDYNQFTLILSRTSKKQAFRDTEFIRQSIEELKFNEPSKGPVVITVSGGFIIKPNNSNLEEAVRQAKKILYYAKTTGTNHILQIHDILAK